MLSQLSTQLKSLSINMSAASAIEALPASPISPVALTTQPSVPSSRARDFNSLATESLPKYLGEVRNQYASDPIRLSDLEAIICQAISIALRLSMKDGGKVSPGGLQAKLDVKIEKLHAAHNCGAALNRHIVGILPIEQRCPQLHGKKTFDWDFKIEAEMTALKMKVTRQRNQAAKCRLMQWQYRGSKFGKHRRHKVESSWADMVLYMRKAQCHSQPPKGCHRQDAGRC
ncbi:hypothetical protein CC80DRAFT_511002 [Byssothecium circinans]|uniref:Uncharacterized protein n=1 Tax=Byssothecium circinans TaxID=147558 RepID=A0A6A5T8K8_9PLEO|nr:hypothetical protein CC80DRAFT_511002 [Byssothecium circinans]